MLMMVAQARIFTETYDDDAKKMFYYNFQTEEAVWEVPKTGYVPGDGVMKQQASMHQSESQRSRVPIMYDRTNNYLNRYTKQNGTMVLSNGRHLSKKDIPMVIT